METNDLHTGTLITDLVAAVSRTLSSSLYAVEVRRVEADPKRQEMVVNSVILALFRELEAEPDMERDRR